MELYFRHHPTCCLPARGLVEKAFVPDHGLVARSSYGPRQQLRDVYKRQVVRGYADGILHASFLQRLIDFRLGKGGIGAKYHFLAEFLLALDLRQQQFCPVFRTMHVARSQLARQTVSFPVKQQQWVIAGRFKVAVVGAVLLLPVHRDLCAVHVQHHALRRIDRFRPRISSRLIAASPERFSSWVNSSVSNDCKREVSAAPRSQILSEPMSRKVGSWARRSASFTSS